MAPRLPLIALLVAGVPATALADPVLDGSVIEIQVQLPAGDGEFLAPTDDLEREQRFNLARCYCGEAGIDDERTQFAAELKLEPASTTDIDTPVDVWLGVDCLIDDTQLRMGRCAKVNEFEAADDLNTPQTLIFTVDQVVDPTGTKTCLGTDGEGIEESANVFAAPDFNDTGVYDGSENAFDETGTPIDTKAPPVPGEFTAATGGEAALFLDWEPLEDTDEVWRWQALCGRVDDAAPDGIIAVPDVEIDPLWVTAEELCNADTTEVYVREISSPTPGAPVELPETLATLDPSFICGDAAGTASEMRIEGLENGAQYHIVLIAIDRAGNPAGVTPGFLLEPRPVIDFWEDLHSNGSGVEGGFCMVGSRSSGSGALVSLLLVLAVVWPRRRALVVAAAILVAPAAARAQSFAPYWEDETDVEDDGLANIKWHAGIKMGPYIPAIDAQLGVYDEEGMGPYERVYGGYEILPVLEVDRFVWHPPGGQLGVGGSIGVMGKTANSFRFMDENGDGIYQPGEELTRSKGDRTKFRLVPVAANVIYRLTMLDDEWGIPVVPYIRGGLSYYIWWNTKPNGDVSVLEGNKARGGSLGVQGSAGLAIRAENIDRTAAASMRDGGIYHAGFYAEYQLGWVDGFGNEKKLAVGDNTWFAGVNFEF